MGPAKTSNSVAVATYKKMICKMEHIKGQRCYFQEYGNNDWFWFDNGYHSLSSSNNIPSH